MADSKFADRRRFLGQGLLFGGASIMPPPVMQFVKMMTDGIIQRAIAAETGADPARNYVNLLLPGAPNRYVFDHWLRTNNSDPQIVANPMNTTSLEKSNGRAIGTKYETFEYKNVLVPQFFKHSVFNGAGNARPLTDLLDNMLVIRGYGTGFDGHSPNVVTQLSPLGGASSITGLAADLSTKTFQALQYPARRDNGNYFSTSGKPLNVIGGNKPLHELMVGFKAAAGNTADLVRRREAALEQAAVRLRQFAKSNQVGSSTVAKNMTDAQKLIKKGISNIDSYWEGAVARYTKAYTMSAQQMGLAGFSDMTLEADPNNPHWRFHVYEGNQNVQPRGDVSGVISKARPSAYLIEGFALAEYVLTEGHVTALELMVPGGEPGHFYFKDGIVENITAPNNTYGYVADMHLAGAIGAQMTTAVLFRGISGALLELIDRLKATPVNGSDLWSQTVFQITSDFGRSGHSLGDGCDHGINQMVTSVYSGLIKQPMVVGNIWTRGNNPGVAESVYGGTQGAGAPIENYNQKGMPTPVMMASTVAGLLVDSQRNPFINVAYPAVSVAGGSAQALFPGKIVAAS